MIRIIKAIILSVLSFSTFLNGLPINALGAKGPEQGVSQKSSQLGELGSQFPRSAGTDQIPDLSLPKTVVSSLDSLIGSGGVVQTSPDNLTLYNLGVRLRLLGGSGPRDELIGPGGRIFGKQMFWVAEVQVANAWIPLVPRTSMFTLIGTNSSGTFVKRSMTVALGSYAGVLDILYKATSAGLLKWDVEFTPSKAGEYRLVLNWLGIPDNAGFFNAAKTLTVGSRDTNFTLAWSDVPGNLKVSTATAGNNFALAIELGSLPADGFAHLDPSIGSSNSYAATAPSFQRKVVFDSKGSYYFVFYYDGAVEGWRYSHDGVSWSAQQPMPSGWPGFYDTSTSSPAVLTVGQKIIIATGQDTIGSASCGSTPCGLDATIGLKYAIGTIAGSTINWESVGGQVTRSAVTRTVSCSAGAYGYCGLENAIRHVNLGMSSDGKLAFSFNWGEYFYPYSCGAGYFSGSYLQVLFNSEYTAESVTSCNSYVDLYNQHRSLIQPMSAQSKMRLVYAFYPTSGLTLKAATVDSNGVSSIETIEGSIPSTDQFSGVSDTSYGNHAVYRMTDGTAKYVYWSPGSPGWSVSYSNIFSGAASYPSLTLDGSSNDLYAVAIRGQSIILRSKTLNGGWYDRQVAVPVSRSANVAYLGTNLLSAGGSNSSWISTIWTEGSTSPFSVWFAAIPIPTVWSPFASSVSPWDGNGVVPYGQYFSSLGESVSPNSGMLTVLQSDLSTPGRGLSLDIARVYTEPPSFMSGNPYNVESPYVFRDDSFSAGWNIYGDGTLIGDGNVATVTQTASSPNPPEIVKDVMIDTSKYPYLFWRLYGSNQYQVGVQVGSTEYKYSYPPDPAAPGSWTTLVWNVGAATGGAVVTQVKLWAVGVAGSYVKYDYVGFTNASMGNGWQLNFPWMSYGWQLNVLFFIFASRPSYLHLWNGQGYRIPSNFWDGNSATWENHQGEQFRLVRRTDGTISLYTKLGTAYNFDIAFRLSSIVDSTGNNQITFVYDSQFRLWKIIDTVQRTFLFCYDTNIPFLVKSINQTTGSCSSGAGSVKGVIYNYDSQLGLSSVTDSQGRVTGYQYYANVPASVSPWLLSRITYPTGWRTDYTFTQSRLGIDDDVYTYRVFQQTTNPSSGPVIRKFEYSYVQAPGDQVTSSTVKSYNGTSTNPASFTEYAFSFAGMTRNVTDANHRLVSGLQQKYGVHGEVVKEIAFVTSSNPWYWTKSSPSSGWNSDPNWFYGPGWGIAADARAYGQLPYGGIQNWQDLNAKWIWSQPDAANAAPDGERVWFRTVFYAPVAGTYNLDITADDIYKVYVDGSFVGQDQVLGGWTVAETWSVTLSNPGYHVLAVDAQNTCPSCGGPQPAGLLVSLRRATTGQVIVRSDRSVGSYSNLYRYDSWGDLIYTSRTIDSSANLRHDSYFAYYNNGLPLGFYSFIDTFSDNEWHGADNPNWTDDFIMPSKTPDPCCTVRMNRQNMYVLNGRMHFDVDGYPVGFYFYSDEIPISSTYPHWNVVFDWKAHSGTSASSVTNLDFQLKFSNGTRIPVSTLVSGGYTDISGSYSSDLVAKINDATAHGNTWVKLVWHIEDGWDVDWGQTGDIDNVQVSPGATFSSSFYPDGDGPGPTGLNTWLLTTKAPQAGWNTVSNWNPATGWSLAVPALDYSKPSPPWGTISGWTDSLAQWIWWNRDSWVSSTDDPVWFRRAFTLNSGTTLTIEITADNYYDLYVDGTLLGSNGDWTTREVWSKYLNPGPHVLAVYADNNGPANPAGLLLSARDSSNQVVFRTEGASGPNIVAGAGSAELRDRNAPPLESYLGYNSWGGATQSSQRYDSGGTQWLGTTTSYDKYGNVITYTDAIGTLTNYRYSSTYSYAYQTQQARILPGAPTIFTDDFNDGNYNGWTVGAGTWAVESGELSSSGAGDEYIGTGDVTWPVTLVQVDVREVSGQDYSIDFLWDGGTDHYRMQTWDNYQSLRLFKADMGGYTQLAYATLSGITPTAWHTWKAVFSSGTIMLYIDNILRISYADSSPSVTGKIMFRTNGSHVHFDNLRVEYSNAVVSLQTYDSNTGGLLSSRDPMGNVTNYQYDKLGRTLRVSYPTNGADFAQYTYNDASNYAETMNELGWKSRRTYDGLGRLTKTETFMVGASYATESYTYDGANRVIKTVDASGRTFRSSYDLLGRTIDMTKPDGSTVRNFYNDLGSWVRYTDEDGNNQCKVYDRAGRLISVIEKASILCETGVTTNYYYDELGKIVRAVTSTLKTTSHTYDNLRRLTGTVYPDGSSESYTYNNDGYLVRKIDRSAKTTLYSYDTLGQIKTICYCGATPISDNYSFDKNGRLVRLESQNATLTYSYDARSRLINEGYTVNPGNTMTDLGCGSGGGGGGSVAYGTLITLADRTSIPVQNLEVGTNLLSYDPQTGQYQVSTVTKIEKISTTNMLVIRTEDPLPLRVDNATAQKLWVKKTDGSIGWFPVTELRVGDYLFNALDIRWTRVTAIEYAKSGVHEMYDIFTTQPHNYVANGYLDPVKTSPKPVSPSIATASVSTTSSVLQTYTLSYDYKGEVLGRIVYPDGVAANYTYDALGRVLSVFTPGGTTYATFSYYQDGQVKGVGFGNSLVGNYTYDTDGRLSTILLKKSSTTMLSLAYTYNNTGTIGGITGSIDGATVNEQYRYDALQRLTNSTVTRGSTTTSVWYEYDNVGNRLRQKQSGIITSYNYNMANNELSSSSSPSTSTSYSYDANGNLITKAVTTSGTSTWTYNWDLLGRLLKVTKDGTVQGSYAYDAKGRRLESIEGSSTIFYAYAGTETLYEKISGGASTDYIYAAGLRVGRISNSNVNYYHLDHLGNTRLVTSASKSVLFSDSYLPFGQDNGTPTGSETYKFNGKPYSSATGLFYYYQRWYDPVIGRFISPDPILGHLASPQTLNRYAYVGNGPVFKTDPSGLDCLSSVLDFFGCAGSFLYDNTIGAAIDSINWIMTASPEDRNRFLIGVGIAVLYGVIIGASCVVAACAGLVLLAIGIGVGIGGSFIAADVYMALGGRSERGIRAALFWGGIGAGAGFAIGEAGVGALWNKYALPDPDLDPGVLSAAKSDPGTTFRVGTKWGKWYTDRPYGSIGALEDEFGNLPRQFTHNLYRITARFGPGVDYQMGRGSTGLVQYFIVNGQPSILSASLYSLSPAAISVITAAMGPFVSAIVSYS